MKKISMRGRRFTGVVISDKMANTVTVEWSRRRYIPKYERYEVRKTKVKAHNPVEIDAVVGDKVVITETRPLSKTKHFIVVKKLDDSKEIVKDKKVVSKKEKSDSKNKVVKKPFGKKASDNAEVVAKKSSSVNEVKEK